ncbi:MAG: chromate efflux transporter [Pseudolysinimonas sp.]|uniref:chromate efflux transporter n=1 Tax=Pseudolysinimonas sp. TaxID=2680009 RepID=UPI003267CB7E
MSTELPAAPRGTAGEVAATFLKLGFTSFGGPIAHLGYFRAELVEKRRWIDEKGYGDLVALSQFLPGPASSQVGFAMGLLRAGPLGAILAFLAFTLPSAILLVAFAFGAAWVAGPIGAGVLAGLKVVAVAVVAQAVLGMARTLIPDRQRAAIAVVAVALVVLVGGVFGQVGAIVLGAIAGVIFCRAVIPDAVSSVRFPVSKTAGVVALSLFGLLLVGLPILAATVRAPAVAVFDAFYRSGALVFGGGHVVLPLLETQVVDPGWVSRGDFLAGYGAAQAVPGPLFSFSAYLGAILEPGPNGILGASIALVAIFLPGFLILIGVLPFWNSLRTRPLAQAGMRGANAAVVGILAAALYDPVFTSAVTGAPQFLLAVICFTLLVAWRVPPWIVVLVGAAGGILIGLF